MTLGNLGYNVTNGAVVAATGTAITALQSLASRALSGNKHALRYYWNKDMQGGRVVQVMASQALGMGLSAVQEYATDALKSLLYKNQQKVLSQTHDAGNYTKLIENGISKANAKYGVISTNEGGTVTACDAYGNKCVDALMLKIPTKSTHTYKYKEFVTSGSGTKLVNTVDTSTDLVWWDCTAIITINSDKNLLLTKVAGRDYSRKELISNGDINFSVSGHILNSVPEVYPTQEVQKFTEIMQYKGWVAINNEVLDQFNIEKIVIKDFQLSHTEGSKANVSYTFNAVGVMPEKEVLISGDSIQLLDSYLSDSNADSTSNSKWSKLLEDQVSKLKNAAVDTASLSMSSAAGYAAEGASSLVSSMIG